MFPIDQAVEWAHKNQMMLNKDKTKEMTVYFGKRELNLPAITIDDQPVERVAKSKLLGVILSNTLSWEDNISEICKKASQRLYLLCLLRRAGVAPEDIVQTYTSMLRPVLEYACEVWHTHLTAEQSHALEQVQKRALAIALPDLTYSEALESGKMELLQARRDKMCRQFFRKMQSENHRLHYLLPEEKTATRVLRTTNKYPCPRVRTNRCKNTLIHYGLFHYQ